MLIPTYELEVFTPPCDPGAERFSAVAHLPVDIRDALPYLNATLRGAMYTGLAHSLTWKKAGHNVAFHADRIAVSNVEDRQAAIEELDGLVKLVNRTWERRDEITPDHTTRQRPTAGVILSWSQELYCTAANSGAERDTPWTNSAVLNNSPSTWSGGHPVAAPPSTMSAISASFWQSAPSPGAR
jgi:hypothetical protein